MSAGILRKTDMRKLANWFNRLRFTARSKEVLSITSSRSATDRRPRQRRHMPIPIYQQKYAYSCVAAVTQMIYGFYTGKHLPHAKAVELTGCNPDGAELIVAAQVSKMLCGSTHRKRRTLLSAKHELTKKSLVVCNDDRSYVDPHAILLCGATPAGVYVCDPNTALIEWRSDKWLLRAGANEFIVIRPPRGTHR